MPVCAPNAVCSKIDLYETPWIERQCRCPKSSYLKHPHVILHSKENRLAPPSVRTSTYRHLLEQKVKFDAVAGSASRVHPSSDYDVETEHIENLMHKLGAMYNHDDIMSDTEYADYDGTNTNNVQARPFLKKKFDANSNVVLQDVLKFRHAAHRDVPRIGGCPSSVNVDDGHTIADKTRLYKLCEPVQKLPLCR